MSTLILGLIVFLGIHSVSIVAPAWRDGMAQRLGVWVWKGLYSLVAAVGLVLIVQGWSQARLEPIVLWVSPGWMRHLVMTVMLPVFPLLLAAYLPGRIRAVTRHPMLIATKLWALSHLLVNGSVHEVVLFAGFLAWAVLDRISLKRRQPRATPGLPASGLNDAIVVLGGLALYGYFVARGHAQWIGMPLMPA